MSGDKRLQEIKVVLLRAREAPDYNMGTPRAIDHLLVHVVALIDALIDERQSPASPPPSGA
jgi:hypothetical protein